MLAWTLSAHIAHPRQPCVSLSRSRIVSNISIRAGHRSGAWSRTISKVLWDLGQTLMDPVISDPDCPYRLPPQSINSFLLNTTFKPGYIKLLLRHTPHLIWSEVNRLQSSSQNRIITLWLPSLSLSSSEQSYFWHCCISQLGTCLVCVWLFLRIFHLCHNSLWIRFGSLQEVAEYFL